MTFLSIQYLRAVAALAIVLFHMDLQLSRMGYDGYWPHFLAAGVDVFFVISGFIMWITTWDRPADTAGFYWRRLVRIVPVYWVLTGLAVLAALVSPAAMQSGTLDPRHVVASLLFLPARHPVLNQLVPVLVPGWTLNYEMFFYVLFGLALPLPPPGRVLALGGTLGGLALAGWLAGAEPDSVPGFYTDGIMLEFAVGAGLGFLFTREGRLPWPAALACLGGGTLALVVAGEGARDLPRALVLGLPALLIVAGAVTAEAARPVRSLALPRLLGDASYSIYLSHGIMLSAVGQAWRRLHLDALPGGWAGFGAMAVLVTAVVGVALYWGVERPAMALLRARRPVPAPAR